MMICYNVIPIEYNGSAIETMNETGGGIVNWEIFE